MCRESIAIAVSRLVRGGAFLNLPKSPCWSEKIVPKQDPMASRDRLVPNFTALVVCGLTEASGVLLREAHIQDTKRIGSVDAERDPKLRRLLVLTQSLYAQWIGFSMRKCTRDATQWGPKVQINQREPKFALNTIRSSSNPAG